MAQGRSFAKLSVFLIILLLGAAGVVTWGIQARVRTAAAVKQQTLDLAIPTVSVALPKRGAMKDEVVLPGNIQAYTDSPIYARASGYLKQWHVDIGTRVKAGQVLAELDAPELDQQVRQAEAALAQSRAALEQARATHEQGRTNEDLARVTAQRWNNLLAKGAVSRQENDQYQAQYQSQISNVQALEKAINAGQSTVSSAEANLARLRELQGYKLVKAPFDGVITARNTDVGALVNAGNGGPAQELFHMASTSRLRVFVRLPQVYSRSAVSGVEAELVLSEYPGRRFAGKLARTAAAIDPGTRTLLTEIDVDNQSGALLPGAYAAVHLKLPAAAPSLILPVNALLFRTEGLQVGVVSQEGRVELVNVILGKDYGTEVEVVSGIGESDRVIVNPPDSLTSGVTVRVAGAGAR